MVLPALVLGCPHTKTWATASAVEEEDVMVASDKDRHLLLSIETWSRPLFPQLQLRRETRCGTVKHVQG
ncbi:hypothetical protein OPV22_030869 [Ensete ventricosum]|uniref:Secreted protein n=1 Tax=Ensete ventricosum TaxID=4639 RepID=A0AAV8PN00_ENSVE|nr:hypothetical protein OPV22_030869 [Ensete ventricosum]